MRYSRIYSYSARVESSLSSVLRYAEASVFSKNKLNSFLKAGSKSDVVKSGRRKSEEKTVALAVLVKRLNHLLDK